MRRIRLIEAFGQEKTIREWFEDSRCSVSLDALRGRFRMGWKPEDAIARPPEPPLHEAFGEFKSYAGWSRDKRCVVSFKVLLTRVNDLGWDLERAITQPAEVKSRPAAVRERRVLLPRGDEEVFTAFEETKSLKAWARDSRCRVRYKMLRDRIADGWALEDAILVPSGGGDPRASVPIPTSRWSDRSTLHGSTVLLGFGELKAFSSWLRDARCLAGSVRFASA